jgi:hypothetical protein
MLCQKTHNRIAVFLSKNILHCRDSNPGLLSLRLMRCPMRHAASAPGVNVIITNFGDFRRIKICVFL